MKNLTKIFMAVVALFAVSCVTDPIEDLGVQLGNDAGQTTISVSLEETKTHLGGKDGGEYPLYWSEGDKIAVNGVASAALESVVKEQIYAEFTLNGVLGFPRTIVYPAPAEGVKAATAGQYPVTFAATQAYKAGSFAEGAAPMYAYQSSSSNAVTLNHLSGVLRFAPYGEGVTLKALTVTAENGKLAGNFDVDSEGKLTAHADAVNSVTVTFGDGLKLATDATPIYVAVPAGEFGVVTVTFYAADGSMTKVFNTDGKAINAGKVREFPAFAFEANGEAGDDFLIYDEASLRNLGTEIAKYVGNLEGTINAKLVANIDLTDVDWTPIEKSSDNYKVALILEGDNHEIKGLKAPLFGALYTARIKNLNLVDVDITSSLNNVGALACQYVYNNTDGISNVTVSGQITGVLNNVAADKKIGGIVGYSQRASYTNIHNKANITLEGALSGSTTKYYIAVGGCIGHCNGGADNKNLRASNWKNSGKVIVDSNCNISLSSSYLYVGGVAGYFSYYPSTGYGISNLTNEGDVEVNGTLSIDRFSCGGITGDIRDREMTNFTNSGDITLKSGLNLTIGGKSTSNIGGLVGLPSFGGVVFSNGEVTKDASITIEEGVTITSKSKALQIGGCFGYTYNGALNNVVNNGPITLAGTLKTPIDCGGVVGSNTANISSSSNYGDVKVTGTQGTVNVGGVVGVSTAKVLSGVKAYCNVDAAGLSNVGMLLGMERTDAIKVSDCHAGGTIKRGNATTSEKLSLDNYLSYIYSTPIDASLKETVINGDKCGWLASKTAEPELPFIAGRTVSSVAELQAFAQDVSTNAELATNVQLTADIDLTDVDWTPIEGYAGTFDGGNYEIKGLNAPLFGRTQASIQNLKLTNIDITTSGSAVGALACIISNPISVVKNCSVSGTLTVDNGETAPSAVTGESESGLKTYYGSIIGLSLSNKEFSNLTSNVALELKGKFAECRITNCIGDHTLGKLKDVNILGTLTFNGTATANTWINAVVYHCLGIDNCVNGSAEDTTGQKGSITINNFTTGKILVASGFAGYSREYIRNSHNYGNISISGNSANLYFGGFFCRAEDKFVSEITNCTNNGKISLDITATAASTIGGFLMRSWNGGANLTNCHNNADIEISENSQFGASSVFGGFIASANNNSELVFTNCSNTGAITSYGTYNNSASFGGFLAFTELYGSEFKNCENKGDITIGGTTGQVLNVGGFFGNQQIAVTTHAQQPIKNTGDITCTATATTVNVGGIVANSIVQLSNARCFCKIKAIGYENVGMITGNAFSADAPHTYCHVGGSIKLKDDEEPAEMSDYTFHLYLYKQNADAPITQDDIRPTMCGCLNESINDTPIDVDGNKME